MRPALPVRPALHVRSARSASAALLALLLAIPLTAAAEESSMPAAQATWRKALGARIVGPPAAQAQSVVAVCDDGSLRAFGLTGTELWRYEVSGKMLPHLSRSREGTSYVGLANGSFVAVNRSGRELWRRALGSQLAQGALFGFDGRVFVLTANTLRCFTPAGFLLWRRELPAPPSCRAILDSSGGLVVSLADGRLSRFDAFGTLSSILMEAGALALAEPLARLVVAVLPRGALRAFPRAEDGAFGVPYPMEDLPGETAALGGLEGKLAWLLSDGRTGLREVSSGRELWTGTSPSPSSASQALILPDERGIYFLDDRGAAGFSWDGRRLWYLGIRGASSIPAFSDDGLLFSGGNDWILYAYRLEERVRTDATSLYGKANSRSYGLAAAPPPEGIEDPYRFEESSVDGFLAAVENQLSIGEVGRDEKAFSARLREIASSALDSGPSGRPTHPSVLPFARVRAVDLLARFASREHVDFLCVLFEREGEPLVRAAAASAIGAVGVDPEGTAMTVFSRALFPPQAVKDERLLVNLAAAIGALCRFSGPPLSEEGIRLLVSLAAGERPSRVRSRAVAELELLLR